MKEFREALEEQQKQIALMLEDHRADVEDKFEEKSKHSFLKKNIEKQYEVNAKILRLNKKILREVHDRKYSRAVSSLEEQKKLLKEHEEDLITADSSRFGWLTVQKLKNTSGLASSQLRKIEKVESLIERIQSQYGPQGSSTSKKPFRVDKEVFAQPGTGTVRTRRPNQFQKKSPEQILEECLKQTRVGTCSHCQKSGHFFRECPGFWQKVLDSKEENFGKN